MNKSTMSLQHLQAMGIQAWRLQSKAESTYALVSDEDYTMSDAAQSLLQAMLGSIDLEQEQILTSESLKKHMGAIQPRLLLILGERAARVLLNCNTPIQDLRNKIHIFANTPTIITYHPEYLLQNPNIKREAYKNLCMVKNIMLSS